MVHTPTYIPPVLRTEDVKSENIESRIKIFGQSIYDNLELMTATIPTPPGDCYVTTGVMETPRYHKHSACPHCGAPVDVSRQSCEYCDCAYEME